jgi:thiamine kinase-like enzyme
MTARDFTPQPDSAAAAGVEAMLASLRGALHARDPALAAAALEPLRDKGLAHHHVRLAGTGLVARLPKQSQLGLAAQANLDYQAACFARAAASGRTPRLHGVLPPSLHLPRGGLLVEEIVGRSARLPEDLAAIAETLARIHALALPEAAARPPLLDAPDALAALAAEIRTQAQYLDAARIASTSRRVIDAALIDLEQLCARPERPPRRLISFDAHPGNFIVRADGSAVLVDLEKARYSHPPLDLAHATLVTSTTWDVDTCAELAPEQVAAFYRQWAARIDHTEGAGAAACWQPWQMPLRAAMWLWAVTWCAKWRVLSGRSASASGDGEDWSGEHSEVALVRHVRGRVDDYLSGPRVDQVRDELGELGRLLGL